MPKKINKILATLIALIFTKVFAGSVYTFNPGNLFVFQSGNNLHGLYLNDYHTDGHQSECRFSFTAKKTQGDRAVYALKAEEKNQYFAANGNGRLLIDDENWQILMNFPSAGCNDVPFSKISRNKNYSQLFNVDQKTDVQSVGVLKRSIRKYENSNGEAVVDLNGDSILLAGDVVAEIKNQGDLIFIEHYRNRFMDGQGPFKKDTSGWIRAADYSLLFQ